MPANVDFEGEIRVASRIVDYLSSGLYKSPAACLKELINNSYDADATQVDVFVKPDADRIIIEDNGHGMNREEFEKHFSVISESHKRDDADLTPSGRPKIGKIGIGFIAANEICDEMQLISTKAGSTELLDVTIHFDLMRQDIQDRRRPEKGLAKAHYVGTVGDADRAAHFTQVFLKRTRGEAKAILAGVGASEFASGKESLYGLTADSVLARLRDKNLKTWSTFDAYSRNVLEVGLNVPVRYYDRWMPKLLLPRVRRFENAAEQLNFSVNFDGTNVRKPIVFSPDGRALVSLFRYSGAHVSARGYFYVQHGTIRPQELQGVLVRIRNAAVGEYDPSFLGFSSSIGRLFQTWISSEIMADDRLEDAMNIDRRTLRVAHPAYVELQQAIHAHLADLIKQIRVEIYEAETANRANNRIRETQQDIIDLAANEIAAVSPVAARKVRLAWRRAADNEATRKKLLRRLSVDEVYAFVLEAAKGVLSQAQLEEFLSQLTDRLQQ